MDSEERFRLLIECVRDYAIYMLDTNGIVTSWNSGAERIKGYSAIEAVVGAGFLEQACGAGQVDDLGVERDAGAVEDSSSHLAEGWGDLVLHHLHPGAVADAPARRS